VRLPEVVELAKVGRMIEAVEDPVIGTVVLPLVLEVMLAAAELALERTLEMALEAEAETELRLEPAPPATLVDVEVPVDVTTVVVGAAVRAGKVGKLKVIPPTV
jgi:hypothetical protein